MVYRKIVNWIKWAWDVLTTEHETTWEPYEH
jgi:hypothetical protein